MCQAITISVQIAITFWPSVELGELGVLCVPVSVLSLKTGGTRGLASVFLLLIDKPYSDAIC